MQHTMKPGNSPEKGATMQTGDFMRLAQMIDRDGLAAVIRTLAKVCGEKALHLRAIRQDEVTAQLWERTATYLDQVADTKTVQACPLP
jgi:hypothetical protein